MRKNWLKKSTNVSCRFRVYPKIVVRAFINQFFMALHKLAACGTWVNGDTLEGNIDV